MTTIEVPSPSNTGRIGVAWSNSEGIILSGLVVSDDGRRGAFEQVRIQGRNSTGKITKGAYFRITAAEAKHQRRGVRRPDAVRRDGGP